MTQSDVEAARPPKLTERELASYATNGVVVKRNVFPVKELASFHAEIERLLPRYEDRAGHRRGWIFGTPSQVTAAVARDARIQTLIQDIVHPGIAIHSVKLVAKVPGDDSVCHWHQDEAFYRKPNDSSTFSDTRMSVWIPLQDSDKQNGCLWVVPGSHRWGLEPYITVDYGTCRRKLAREQYAGEDAVPVPVQAGSVVLFSAWTWHHSGPNATNRVRRAFIISYQEAALSSHQPEWRILRPAESGSNARQHGNQGGRPTLWTTTLCRWRPSRKSPTPSPMSRQDPHAF